SNFFAKLSYFNKGKKMLESAIAANKESVELRFLRFMVQANAPIFLNYTANIETDKAFILTNIANMPELKAKQFVIRVLSKSNYLNENEKIKISSGTNKTKHIQNI